MANERERIPTYDGYEQILDNVRMIIRMHAPEESVVKLTRKINNFEDEITEMLAGRVDQAIGIDDNYGGSG